MKDFKDVFNKDFTEGFNKGMEELRKSLSGLDDKIAKQVSASLEEASKVINKYQSGSKNGVFVFTDDGEKTEDGAEKSKRKKSGDKFVDMAPYLDDESLHELTVEFCDSDLETDMEEILPYLNEEDIVLLAGKFKDGVTEFKGLHLEDLFPYAEDEFIDEIFTDKFMNGEIDESMLSFVSDECWHNIVLKYCEDENSDIDIDAIYPFLNDEDINLLFKNYLKRRKSKKE